ncbi:hypothetical protein MKW94_028202 [Papaver nudicaule]|uniref:J domain-containing protein n=1 Tax=Papaver nudicaule TaxID=74823 RepID=A0AA41VBR3_PAPNU|nr:hypothetical protein [Papaver nudicaule]
MEMEIDHYVVLGLSSGEEGRKLTDVEIGKAFRRKALELHPDKRRDDPNANSNFLRLKLSYEVLKDEKTRKQFDDLLRVKRKMMSDLEEKEYAFFARDSMNKDLEEEEARFAKKLKEEMVRIRRDSCRNTGNFFRVRKNARNRRYEFNKMYVFESE